MRRTFCILALLLLLPACAKMEKQAEEAETPTAQLLDELWTASVHERKCDMEKVKRLLAAGADPNAKGWADRKPLYWAVCEGNLKLVRMLIEAGAEVDA